MAVSSSIGRTFTVGQLGAHAYRLAGLIEIEQTPSTAQASFARTALEMLIDGLEVHGAQARAWVFELVPLTVGTWQYDLSDRVRSVGPIKYIAAGEDVSQPSGESHVSVIGATAWQQLGARDQVGRPTLAYAHSETAPPLALWLHPIPDEEGTLRVMCERRLTDADTDGVTLDLEPYWMLYVVTALAAQLAQASSLPAGTVLGLRAQAAELLTRAVMLSKPAGHVYGVAGRIGRMT